MTKSGRKTGRYGCATAQVSGWFLSANFASKRYHDYLYEVDSELVTPQREEYQADAGYSGSRVALSLTRPTQAFMIEGYARYASLEHAVFGDSPLVCPPMDIRDYFILAVVSGWLPGASDETVAH
jgi:outer membrane protein